MEATIVINRLGIGNVPERKAGRRQLKKIIGVLERMDASTTSLGTVQSDGSDRHLTGRHGNLSELDRDGDL